MHDISPGFLSQRNLWHFWNNSISCLHNKIYCWRQCTHRTRRKQVDTNKEASILLARCYITGRYVLSVLLGVSGIHESTTQLWTSWAALMTNMARCSHVCISVINILGSPVASRLDLKPAPRENKNKNKTTCLIL